MRNKLFNLIVATLLTSGVAMAQSDLTLYNFNAIPQSLHVNPAYPQQTKFWVGLPALSGVHFHFHNSGFSLKDIIATGTDINVELANLAADLGGDSHLSINQDVELFGLGFKLGKGFLSMGATQTVDIKMTYPVEILEFISWKAGDPITGFSLNDFNFESTSRTNIYLGYQHKFLKDRLSLGFRGKYMFGQGNVFIDRINVGVDASDPWLLKIRSNTLLRSSGIAKFTADDFDAAADPTGLALTGNNGFAFDFGFDYKLTSRWSLSASVLDIGSITWSENNEDYTSIGEYDFEGLELDLSQTDKFSDVIDNTLDSIKDAFSFDTIANAASYTRSLNPRFFAAINYALTDKHSLGLLYHGRTWNGDLFSDYSVNYQGRWFRGMQFIASYSIINGTTNNVGAGIDFKFGPMQLYLISDNILGAIMYENLQTTNIRIGLNITFYGRKDKKDKGLPTSSPVEAAEEEESEE